MKIEIRMWHKSQGKMYSSGQMVKDQLTLLTDGRFINVSGAAQSQSIIYPNDNLIPMLYTGWSDVNGKKIFEGDILWYEKESYKGDVWFEGTGFKTNCRGWGDENLDLLDECNIEIIGNVYENPEMVEGLIRI